MTKPQTHTPGPWIFAYGSVYREDTLHDESSIRIALMDRNEPHTMPVERDCNARLIAAAPDLLAACQAALKEMQSFRDYWTSPNMNLKRSKALAEELCESAIQKATYE